MQKFLISLFFVAALALIFSNYKSATNTTKSLSGVRKSLSNDVEPFFDVNKVEQRTVIKKKGNELIPLEDKTADREFLKNLDVKKFSKKCIKDEGISCDYLGGHFLLKKDKKNALKFYKKACMTGHYEACPKISGYFESLSKESALKYLKHGCENDHKVSCQIYAYELIDKKPDVAKELLLDLCDRGERSSCDQLGGMVDKEEDSEYARELFKKTCSEGSRYGCSFHAEYMIKDGQEQKGKEILKKSCDSGYHYACRKLMLHFDREDPEENADLKYFTEKCPKYGGDYCGAVGDYFHKNGNSKRANYYFNLGCSLGSGYSCYYKGLINAKFL